MFILGSDCGKQRLIALDKDYNMLACGACETDIPSCMTCKVDEAVT